MEWEVSLQNKRTGSSETWSLPFRRPTAAKLVLNTCTSQIEVNAIGSEINSSLDNTRLFLKLIERKSSIV